MTLCAEATAAMAIVRKCEKCMLSVIYVGYFVVLMVSGDNQIPLDFEAFLSKLHCEVAVAYID
jgi:hypothetical protein